MTEYKFEKNGVVEFVKPEKWSWRAYYTDRTILDQFDTNGFFHQFKEIDQSKLLMFKMMSKGKAYSLAFKKGMKLIHYYKNVVLYQGTPKEQRLKIYCFGYEKGKNKNIMMILPNDELILTGDTNIIKFA